MSDHIDDYEVLRSEHDIIAEMKEQALKLKKEQEKERESNNLEMQVLLQEMDAVLKDKSDQERNFNAIKRKLEKNQMECQEIIDNLQRNIAASERTGFKARADLRVQLDRNCEIIRERDSLVKRYDELLASMEDKSKQKDNLETLLMEERLKNKQNSYLKDYTEFLESEIKKEQHLQERINAKEKMIQQMNSEHKEITQNLREINDSLEEENKILRRQLGEKEEERLNEKKTRMIEKESFEEKLRGQEQRLKEKEDRIKEREEQLRRNEDELFQNMENDAKEKSRLREELRRQENLLKTIDVHTFLTQIENQVDREYLFMNKDNLIDRNTMLGCRLQLILRGVRQLCDQYQINMDKNL